MLDITEEGCDYETVLAPEEELSISLGGILSMMSEEYWEAGDVSLKMVYNVQIAAENKTTNE